MPGDAAGRQVDLRLVVQPQLAALDRAVQPALEREPLLGVVVHRPARTCR